MNKSILLILVAAHAVVGLAQGVTVSDLEGKWESNATISVEGDTILYVDDNGEQPWKVVSHAPAESLVVNNQGAIMILERR